MSSAPLPLAEKITPQAVWDIALTEVHTRLKNDPAAIPATVLSTMLATCQRVMEQQKQEDAISEVEPTDALASLESLPQTRQLQLLKGERDRLLDQVLEIDKRLENLYGDQEEHA